MKTLLLATFLLCVSATFSQALTQAQPVQQIEKECFACGIYEGDYNASNSKLLGYRVDPNKVYLKIPVPDSTKSDYLYLSINNNMTLIPVNISNVASKTFLYGFGYLKYKLVIDKEAPTRSGIGLGAILYTIIRNRTVAERRVCFM